MTDTYLVANGQDSAGNAEHERLRRLWPHSPTVWFAGLQIDVWEKRWDDLFALLDDRQSRPASFGDAAVLAFRTLYGAEKSRTPAALAAARRLLAGGLKSPPSEGLIAPFAALADLGFTDDAFRLADYWSQAPLTAFNSPHYLFLPDGVALRRDPRFIALAARLGLVDYWRSTGKWPDFCAEPGLPYDCKAQAAKVMQVRHG